MNRYAVLACRGLVTLALLAFPLGPVWSQYPYPPQPNPPQVVPPPLMYLKFVEPAGMRVTFYRGAAGGQTAVTPCTFGFRPGYSFRCQLSEIPGYPGLKVYPTLEVRASLILGNRLRNAEFPAALVFRRQDFEALRVGAMVTKVIVLERPDTAIPLASKADDPLQIDVAPNRNPLQESLQRGRALVLLHMGQRQLSEMELISQGISGTVLMPGEKVLPLPRTMPWIPWTCYPVFDPILGPPHPAEEITLFDGGDVGLQAGQDLKGKIRGLDPSDTVAQYTDSQGRPHIAVSNRVGLCIPRFVIFRGETGLAGQLSHLSPGRSTAAQGGQLLAGNVPPLEQHQNVQPMGVQGGQRPSSTVNTLGTAITGRIDGLNITASTQETGSVQGSKEPPPAVEPHDKPLRIIKFPDKKGGLIGDVITFTIRYSNTGGRPISSVIVSDSLITRFEYVPGSTKSDRPSVFTTQANDAGSTVLRWEILGTLPPGESGTVSFQVRIR